MARFPATKALVLAMFAAFFVQFVSGVMGYMRDAGADLGEALMVVLTHHQIERTIALGAITPDTLYTGQWWRLLTAIFLHGGLLHLVFNAWALLQGGTVFERLFGSRRLLLVFFATGLVASIASAVFLEMRAAVGASGAIFGVLGALLVLIGTHSQRWAASLRMQLAVWAAAILVAGLFSVGIDNAAHIGGFTAGLATGALLRRLTAAPLARAR